jgi:hypothetical protein
VSVQFDEPQFSVDDCHCFYESEIKREGVQMQDNSRHEIIEALFEALASESKKGPLIFFLQNAVKLPDYGDFQKKLDKVEDTVVVIASHSGTPKIVKSSSRHGKV